MRINSRARADAITAAILSSIPKSYQAPVLTGDNVRTAEGGLGETFSPYDTLRRAVATALLGETTFYENGQALTERMAALVPQVTPFQAIDLMQEARIRHGLRHTPLLLAVEAARRPEARALLREGLGPVLRTPRDAMDLLALYWSRNPAPEGRQRAPLPNCFKAAIRDAFGRWDEFRLRKYGTLADNVAVRLRDLMFMAHPKPDEALAPVYAALADQSVTAPDTWEALLSKAGPDGDKREVWEKLLVERKLGALALVRNLRNMRQAGVRVADIAEALAKCRAQDVWPWQALAAARHAPELEGPLSDLMVRACGPMPRLPGKTVMLVDVSSSMNARLSAHGEMERMDAAAGLAVICREVADVFQVVTFSNHFVALDPATAGRGTALAKTIIGSQPHGGTELSNALDHLERVLAEPLHRLIIPTDEQTHGGAVLGRPMFGRVTLINLAPHATGVRTGGQNAGNVRHEGNVDRIDGWSANVLRYIAEREGIHMGAAEDEAEVA